MKSVLISIRPKWVEKIASGEKTIEVRKTAPQEVPFKAYIYCTKKKPFLGFHTEYVDGTLKKVYTDHLFGSIPYFNGKVIGEFICDKVYSIKNQGSSFSVADEEQGVTNEIARQSCLDYYDMVSYLGNKDGYGLHITALKIYDKPKELSEFKKTKEIIARTCGMQAKNGLCRAIDHEELCDNIKCCFKTPCPPQSWCYVEALEEQDE